MAAGDFCWFDRMGSDGAGAQHFYSALFGWDIRTHNEGYSLIHDRKGQRLGGMMHNAGTNAWLAYVTVDDLDQTVSRIKAGGGQILVRHQLPNVGHFAIFLDPQGAYLAAIQHASPVAPYPREKGENHISWSELRTTDPSAALTFYHSIFGWPHQRRGDDYLLVGTEHSAGIMKSGVVAHWLCYINTSNTDQTVARALELGGGVLTPATDMPGVGRFAVLTDPGGAVFAVMGG